MLIHVDTEKSELLVNNRFAYLSVSRAPYEPTSTQMTGASFPVVSVARVRGVERQRWSNKPAVAKTEPVSQRGGRPSEEEQGS